MNDEILLNEITKDGNFIKSRCTESYLRNHGLYDYVICRYNDNTTDSIAEILYRIKNKIDSVPVCKICGNKLTYDIKNKQYPTYCSKKCSNSDPDVLKKNAEAVSAFRKEEYRTRKEEVQAKKAATLKEHYGEDCKSPFSCSDVKESIKRTFNEKYGTDNYVFSEEERNKALKTRNIKRKAEWARRGLDIDYTDHKTVIVHNGCEVHGDFEISVADFNNRTKPGRLGKVTLCPLCNPIKRKLA